MKKFAKMSLVAAVAVAGMTTANAKDLTEAIKNVDVSGTVVYRYNDYDADTVGESKNDNKQYYKAVLNLKSKVNEDVTANISVAANNNFGAFDYQTGGDTNVDVQLTKVNFAYTGLKNTTVIVGKQGLPTPWTISSDSDGAEQTGTGILALSTWGPVTFAGAYFNQNNFQETIAKGRALNFGDSDNNNEDNIGNAFTGAEDIATAGIIANLGPVALDAWYLSLEDDTSGAAATLNADGNVVTNASSVADVSFDSYTIGAKYGMTISDIKLGLSARYTNLDFDNETTNQLMGGKAGETENELWKVALSAKMGIFGADILYAETGEDGGFVAVDGSAKTAVENWNVSLNGQRDASLIKYKLNAQVMPKLNVALQYNERDSDAADTNDAEEFYTQITYKMSKNFAGYVRLGQYSETDATGKDQDANVGRLQVQYSF